MASPFLQLNRSDASACQRAFDRIAAGQGQQRQGQGKATTIPSSELVNCFKYLGAVTSPETLDQIVAQFTSYSELTREDVMNYYAMWLGMVSVSEPPALDLLDQRRIVLDTEDAHWVDRISAYLGNRNVLLLNIFRTIIVMLFTLVHWFSVFFRDADENLRCGSLGIGLDVTLTILLGVDLFIEFAAGDYRDELIRMGDEQLEEINFVSKQKWKHERKREVFKLQQKMKKEQKQQKQQNQENQNQEEMKDVNTIHVASSSSAQSASASASAAAAVASNDGSTNALQPNSSFSGGFASSESFIAMSPTSIDQSFASVLNPTQQQQQNLPSGTSPTAANKNEKDNTTTNVNNKRSNSSPSFDQMTHDLLMSVVEEKPFEPLEELPVTDQIKNFISLFFLNKAKNVLALLALLPIDLFLCAGDAVTAATVLNHIRLLAVFRNFLDVNPPTPVPLTAMFADIYYQWMPLWMMTYTFIIICSCFAIVLIIFRHNNTLPEATKIDFLTAFYLVVQTFTTVGYGDIIFVGTAETWFAVVLVLVGMITNATVIGSLVALIQLGNATLVRGDKIRETHAVLHYFSIPRLLQLEILGFQEHVLFSDVYSAFHSETEPFPPAVKDAMMLQHRLDVLKQIEPFSKASADELFFVAKELCAATFKPEEYLSCCSEPHHGMRILLFGLVDRLDSHGRYIKTLRSGDCFGLDGILSGKDEEYNHKALAYCDLLIISYDDFHNVLDAMPKLRNWIVPELKVIEEREEMLNNAAALAMMQQQSEKNNNSNNNVEQQQGKSVGGDNAAPPGSTTTTAAAAAAKVLRSPVSMIDTTGANLSMIHDLRSELRVLRRGLQTLAVSPALTKK